ncbi:hypothetical protein HUJ04_002308 [Dendroctonus ponderosae]|nr:hypothetical protein HUJ04_002308 [Dendroctonus ponderosae]
MALVMLPSDLPWWDSVKKQLKKISETKNTVEIVQAMQKIYEMCKQVADPEDDTIDPEQFVGFLDFLETEMSCEERSNFLNQTLPNIVKRALMIKELRPRRGVHFSLQQQTDVNEFDYSFAASLLANAFFSTFPKRTHKSHPTLQNFNFASFFKTIQTSNAQKAKLRSVLHYFDWLEKGDNAKGSLRVLRQVMHSKEWLTIDDWLECSLQLCPLQIKHDGQLNRSEAQNLQICFSSSKLGGEVLGTGCTQESISFATIPEMLTVLLNVEALEDNEVITVERVRHVARIADPKHKAKFEKLDNARDVKNRLASSEVSVSSEVFHLRRCKPLEYLSYVHNHGSEPLRSLTLGQLLEQTAKKYGSRTALICRSENQKLTFQEVLDQADRLAAGFTALGLKPGDRLGVWAPNVAEWYLTHMASARGGFVLVNINPAYQPRELESCVNLVGVKALVCMSQTKNHDYYGNLVSLCPEMLQSRPGKLRSKAMPTLENIVIAGGTNLRGTLNYHDVLNMATEAQVDKVRKLQGSIDPDQLCHLQFTSGTTGQPKAPMQSHFQIVNNSYCIGKRHELGRKHHSICIMVPFFHGIGTVITICSALNYGSTLVVPAPLYNPEKTLDAIRDEKCSVIIGTPTMYVDLVDRQKARNEDIDPEIAISGGAICSPHLFKQMKDVLKLKKVKQNDCSKSAKKWRLKSHLGLRTCRHRTGGFERTGSHEVGKRESTRSIVQAAFAMPGRRKTTNTKRATSNYSTTKCKTRSHKAYNAKTGTSKAKTRYFEAPTRSSKANNTKTGTSEAKTRSSEANYAQTCTSKAKTRSSEAKTRSSKAHYT